MSAAPAWFSAWQEYLRVGPGVPQWVLAIIALLYAYFVVILPSSAVMSYLERKFGADLQARIGPTRAGPSGVFQPIADLLKLLQKETRIERSWGERLWLAVHTMALYSTVAVLPLGSSMLLVNTDMSAFLPFWAALVLALGTMLLGLNQASVPGWFGGVRVAAQALAGAFPALISLLCAGIHASSFKWSEIAASQGASPFTWAAFSNPFLLLGFVTFVMSGLVLLGIPPMDAGLSVSDIHGGVAARLNGRRYTLFRLGRFYGFFLWSVIAVVLFLGGWNLPAFSLEGFPRELLELAVLLAKTFAVMLLVVWVARTNPRDRSDQVTDLAWRVLSPLSLVALAGCALWIGGRSLM